MKKYEVFKCKECGVLVESLLDVVCDACCKEESQIDGFDRLEPKTADATAEKHVPYVEEHDDGYVVKIGKEAAHPMTPEHYIQFIEIIIDGDRLYRKYLKPGDEPMACFKVVKGTSLVAREYCNIHGLWKS